MKKPSFIKRVWIRYKESFQKNRKKTILKTAGLMVTATLLITLVFAFAGSKTYSETAAYRETMVTYGSLTVGVEASGTVDIGTTDQTFDLDLSALVRNTTSSSSTASSSGSGGGMGNMGGGGDMFSQMVSLINGSSSSSSASSANDLVVEEVAVTEGQQIHVGDVLYTLTTDSVDTISAQLTTDVSNAEGDLDSVLASQQTGLLQADQTYESSIAYGSYAATEYNATVESLQADVDDVQEEIDELTEEITKTKEKLEEIQAEYEIVTETYNAFLWSRDHTDKSQDVLSYSMYESGLSSAKTMKEAYEDTMEQYEDTIEEDEEKLEELTTKLAQAKRKLESGTLDAKKTYELRNLAYSTAQETLDVAVSSLELDTAEQEATLEDAKEKLEEFTQAIQNYTIVSEYDGIITDIALEAGDSVDTGETLITLYDQADITMTVSVSSSDVANLSEGGKANITYTAFPDLVYTGIITEIGDATTDSSGNITYSVTVSLDADNEGLDQLYQGMTGEVTFITKEQEDVLYVSNRAILRSGNRSYVKIKDAEGNITTKEVTTGFSDGVNVEIIEGLSEGDVVLIESKVSES
ncbi:MAG: efflux RND transporter periplasmic adaptor subunit [Lachnospiraceae bacterium]|nr:efflux RND transporter periplasmic adaptor subunit [Lachnospiraceae bacterium]